MAGFWLVKKDPKPRLPVLSPYPFIDRSEDIPAGSILVHYGNYPWVTEKRGRLVGFPYQNTPGHITVKLDGDRVLTQGRWLDIVPFQNFRQSTRRVDAIVYKDMSPGQAREIVEFAEVQTRRSAEAKKRAPWWTDYGLKELMWAGGFKWFKEDERTNICSEIAAAIHSYANHRCVTKTEEARAYPWDFLFYAWEHPNLTSLHTVHFGSDYQP